MTLTERDLLIDMHEDIACTKKELIKSLEKWE